MTIKEKKVYVAGASGMVGKAIVKELINRGFSKLLTPTSSELNLIRQSDVERFFFEEKPEIVIVAAAKVGGIVANNEFRADFIYQNLMMEANVINAAFENRVEKLAFLGSSCIYPKFAPQPLKEEYLLSDYLEFTNEPYAVAKIAGIKLCENYYRQYGCNFFSLMPTNLYGANDNFNLQNSHVIPALIRKFHEAKINNSEKVILWGTGKPRREFMYVDDLANAVIFFTENLNASDIYDKGISHINIGTGEDIEIIEAARLIKEIVGFTGEIETDTSKPDGTPQKLSDISRLRGFGWKHQTSLNDGLRRTYQWFLENYLVLKK